MSTLLKIDVSPRVDNSVSRALGTTFASRWIELHPSGSVVERDLAKMNLPFVELPWISASHIDAAARDDQQRAALAVGDELISELKASDEWLITTPIYNFAAPARLKAYIDHIIRPGVTFQANPDGSYTGLLTGKKVTVIVASAGEYSADSPMKLGEDLTPNLRRILSVVGVTDVKFVLAGTTWKVDAGLIERQEFLAGFSDQLRPTV